jgi:hypothetical protein
MAEISWASFAEFAQQLQETVDRFDSEYFARPDVCQLERRPSQERLDTLPEQRPSLEVAQSQPTAECKDRE